MTDDKNTPTIRNIKTNGSWSEASIAHTWKIMIHEGPTK